MEFKVGDRVLCVAKYDGNESIVNMTGTVLQLQPHWVSIEYDELVDEGHDCDGLCTYGYGWNTGYECLELYKEPELAAEVTIPYEALSI